MLCRLGHVNRFSVLQWVQWTCIWVLKVLLHGAYPCPCRALQISTEWEMNTDNVVEWKLVDVPELGYFTTDKPFSRGELVLKTRGLIKGYFKHPKVRNDHPSLVMRGPER